MTYCKRIITLCIFSFLLGSFSGLVIWFILKIMNVGMEFFWTYLPSVVGIENTLPYNLVICTMGGVLIGLWQKKYGLLPDTLAEVLSKIKREHTYPYHNLPIVAISALLPLIFGGALGPEAGLTGIIAGLCYFVNHKLKQKENKIMTLTKEKHYHIFQKPLSNNSKKIKRIIYLLGILGGIIVMAGMTKQFGGGLDLPRFPIHYHMGLTEWKWFIPFIALGIILGLFYEIINQITQKLGKCLLKYRISSCITAGIILAIIGHYLPLTMFSGEHDMSVLIENWQTYSIAILILSAIGKLFLVNLCINFGWRGGSIFPIIFSGVAAGYAIASIIGLDASFTVAVIAASLYAYIMKKPLAVVIVMLLCFPITYIIPMGGAALISSKIPKPNFSKKCLKENA